MIVLSMRNRKKSTSEQEKDDSEDCPNYLPKVHFIGEVSGNIVFQGKPLFESISVYIRYAQLFMTHTLKSMGSLAFPSIVYIVSFSISKRESHILLWRGRRVGQQQEGSEHTGGIQHVCISCFIVRAVILVTDSD